jgi:PKD repeat protein
MSTRLAPLGDRQSARVATRLCVVALVAALVVSPVAAGVALAQPSTPATYHGSVTVDGDAAPAGLTVSATVAGETEDTLETTSEGSFGGPGAFDEKLEVNAEDGDTVVFRVEGKRAGSVAYESGDDREVSLAVSDEGPPSVEVGPDVTVPVGESVSFDGEATDDLAVDATAWDFDDGATATGESARHAYDEPGTYTVRFTATDVVGAEATDTLTVTVEESTPTPTATPTETPTTSTPTETPTTSTPTATPTPGDGGGGGGGGGGNP